jgi:hypothetical protein
MTNSAATIALLLPTSDSLSSGISDMTRQASRPCSPEQELTIQVGDIDRVHVDHMDIVESHCIHVSAGHGGNQ